MLHNLLPDRPLTMEPMICTPPVIVPFFMILGGIMVLIMGWAAFGRDLITDTMIGGAYTLDESIDIHSKCNSRAVFKNCTINLNSGGKTRELRINFLSITPNSRNIKAGISENGVLISDLSQNKIINRWIDIITINISVGFGLYICVYECLKKHRIYSKMQNIKDAFLDTYIIFIQVYNAEITIKDLKTNKSVDFILKEGMTPLIIDKKDIGALALAVTPRGDDLLVPLDKDLKTLNLNETERAEIFQRLANLPKPLIP